MMNSTLLKTLSNKQEQPTKSGSKVKRKEKKK